MLLISHALLILARHTVPKDEYYDGGDRYRSLNRVRAEIVEGGVKVWLSEESTPYVQLKKYNTTIGGQPREYAPLPPAIAGSICVRKMIAHHLYADDAHWSRPSLFETSSATFVNS
jgi:hypothetical protein